MYTIKEFLDQCYEAQLRIKAHKMLTPMYHKVKNHIANIESDLYVTNLSDILTNEIISNKIHFVYMINLLYMGCLFTRNNTSQDVYDKTLCKFDSIIERVFAKKFINKQYMTLLEESEMKSIDYYYSLLTV